MSNNNYKSLTQRFIEIYQHLDSRYEGEASEEQLYGEAIELLKKGQEAKKETTEDEEAVSLSSSFKEALSKEKEKELAKLKIDVRNIFKD